jgi:hypothetical protein
LSDGVVHSVLAGAGLLVAVVGTRGRSSLPGSAAVGLIDRTRILPEADQRARQTD